MKNKIWFYLKNKYILTVICLILWLLFFDRNDIFSQLALRQELKKLENDKAYYEAQIKVNNDNIKNLVTNPANLEKFAREKYLMKKDDEDLFVIITAEEK
jgi:cell division protein DivIC